MLSSKYHPILSSSYSIPSLFSRIVVRILSLLLLVYFVLTGMVSKSILSLELLVLVVLLAPLLNGMFSTSFISVVFFLSTFQPQVRGFTLLSSNNFVLPLPLPLLSMPSLVLGARSLVS